MFACAHPAIDPGIRAPLICRPFLDSSGDDRVGIFGLAGDNEPAAGARQEKIRQAGIPFRVPSAAISAGDWLRYSIPFMRLSRGWCDPGGTDAAPEPRGRGDLARPHGGDLMPDESEAFGLLALMLYAEARRGARRNERGEFVPLEDQDVSQWDDALIDEAEALLLRASGKGDTGAINSKPRCSRLMSCAGAAAIRLGRDRANLRRSDRMTGSPVVAINRAIAIAEAHGAGEGLAALDELAGDQRLAEYQPYWAARAGLLAKAGQIDLAIKPMNRRSVWRATPPSAVSCNNAKPSQALIFALTAVAAAVLDAGTAIRDRGDPWNPNYDPCAAADEARRKEDRRSGRLGYQIAQIIDRAGVESSRSATPSASICGAPNPLEVTMEEMIVVLKAVRREQRALVSCDFRSARYRKASTRRSRRRSAWSRKGAPT